MISFVWCDTLWDGILSYEDTREDGKPGLYVQWSVAHSTIFQKCYQAELYEDSASLSMENEPFKGRV